MTCEAYVPMGIFKIKEERYSSREISIYTYTGKTIETMRLLKLGITPPTKHPETLNLGKLGLGSEKREEIPYGFCKSRRGIVFCQGVNPIIDLLVRQEYGSELEPLLREYQQEPRELLSFLTETLEKLRKVDESLAKLLTDKPKPYERKTTPSLIGLELTPDGVRIKDLNTLIPRESLLDENTDTPLVEKDIPEILKILDELLNDIDPFKGSKKKKRRRDERYYFFK